MRQPLLWVCCCRASLNASSSPAGFATTSGRKLWAWSMQHLALAAVHACSSGGGSSSSSSVSAVYAPAAARPWLHQAGCTSRRCHDRLQQSTRTQTISPSTISSTKTSAASWAPCSGPWHTCSSSTTTSLHQLGKCSEWKQQLKAGAEGIYIVLGAGSSRTPCGSRSARTAAAQPQMGAVGCHPGLCTAHEREEAAASTS
ncbi:hypothetical protein COO60DRAFT_1579356 [Scenedesmus sp. NREL 46B-D3]|nr:hypothetical protein COO60DRAFT_1579356 [Scenedesmus sp. NREL 46B-D3]